MTNTVVSTNTWLQWVQSRIDEVFTYGGTVPHAIIQGISDLMIFHILNSFDLEAKEDDIVISHHWINRVVFGDPYYLSQAIIAEVEGYGQDYGKDRASWVIAARTIHRVTKELSNKLLDRKRTLVLSGYLTALRNVMPKLEMRSEWCESLKPRNINTTIK